MTIREWMKMMKNKLEMFSAGRTPLHEDKSADEWQTIFDEYSVRDVDPEINKFMTVQEYQEWSRRQRDS